MKVAKCRRIQESVVSHECTVIAPEAVNLVNLVHRTENLQHGMSWVRYSVIPFAAHHFRSSRFDLSKLFRAWFYSWFGKDIAAAYRQQTRSKTSEVLILQYQKFNLKFTKSCRNRFLKTWAKS